MWRSVLVWHICQYVHLDSPDSGLHSPPAFDGLGPKTLQISPRSCVKLRSVKRCETLWHISQLCVKSLSSCKNHEASRGSRSCVALGKEKGVHGRVGKRIENCYESCTSAKPCWFGFSGSGTLGSTNSALNLSWLLPDVPVGST